MSHMLHITENGQIIEVVPVTHGAWMLSHQDMGVPDGGWKAANEKRKARNAEKIGIGDLRKAIIEKGYGTA